MQFTKNFAAKCQSLLGHNFLIGIQSPASMNNKFRKVTHACVGSWVVFHTLGLFGNANINSVNYSTGLKVLANESSGFYMKAPRLDNSVSKLIPRVPYFCLLRVFQPRGQA